MRVVKESAYVKQIVGCKNTESEVGVGSLPANTFELEGHAGSISIHMFNYYWLPNPDQKNVRDYYQNWKFIFSKCIMFSSKP